MKQTPNPTTEEANRVAPVGAGSMQKPYFVVCADMASYSGAKQSIDCYDLVFTVAAEEYTACDQARLALPPGGIPLAAFDQSDLQKLITKMTELGLKPGEAYNWSHELTAAQMQEQYSDGTDEGTNLNVV